MLALNQMVTLMRSRLIRLASIAMIFAILSAAPQSSDAQAEEPWTFLQDFTPVSGAVRPVNDGYVGAVLTNSATGYFALVVYPGVCRRQSCSVENPVAYFVVDTKGILVRHHLEPGATIESMISGFQIS